MFLYDPEMPQAKLLYDPEMLALVTYIQVFSTFTFKMIYLCVCVCPSHVDTPTWSEDCIRSPEVGVTDGWSHLTQILRTRLKAF